METNNIPSLGWEEWKDIPWYEWIYMASNYWQIKSLDRFIIDKWWNKFIIGKILKHFNNGKWYRIITLNKNWIQKWFKLHRLIASVFLWLNLSSKNICVCHKDDNPCNNRLDNLFLGTQKDNTIDMVLKWRWNYFYWFDNKKSHQVSQFNIDWTFIKTWGSICTVNRELWISRQWIMNCCKWKLKTSWWFIWKYEYLEVTGYEF